MFFYSGHNPTVANLNTAVSKQFALYSTKYSALHERFSQVCSLKEEIYIYFSKLCLF
jgi:hypothetical protein